MDREFEQPFGRALDLAMLMEFARAHLRVAVDPRAGITGELHLARSVDPLAN